MATANRVRFQCPRCGGQNQALNTAVGATLNCRSCDWSRAVSTEDLQDETPTRCLICGNRDLWKQKDFPQTMGFAFVAIGAVGSSIAWYFHRPVLALGILLCVAAIDFVLFAIMPDVLVCYRCQARHSGGDISKHATFDHEVAERYRQEQLRLDQSAGQQNDGSSMG